jgi:phosphoribosylformimino-5-aminoimidazole carboxamide ribotide isomerase
MVATHGWLEDSEQTVLEFAARADELPLAAIIYTDIAKDGMLTGPNIERTKALAKAVRTPVIASGGVKEVDDIRRLNPIGVAGVIVGRSLYEGTLTLREAIAAAR